MSIVSLRAAPAAPRAEPARASAAVPNVALRHTRRNVAPAELGKHLTRSTTALHHRLFSAHRGGFRRQMRSATTVQASSSSRIDVAAADTFEVSLPTKEAQQSIKFALARVPGRGTAVIISRLSGGTAASEAGVRPGMRLLAISDPMRPNDQLWALNDRPSMRFIRDALAMRSSADITLRLTRESLYAPGASMQSQMSVDEIDSAAGGAAAERQSHDGEAAADEQTLGERLQQQFRDEQDSLAAQQTAFERRQRKRKEFFEKESARDDGTFLLTTAAVILLPAIAILLVAYFTGYLDRLSDPYSTSSF